MAASAPQSSSPATVASGGDTRTLVIIVYGLYLAALLCFGLSGIAGVILAYIKRDDAKGTIWESHFENAIHAFWIWFGLSVLGILTIWFIIGFLILLLAYVYFAYRTIKGLVQAIESKAYVLRAHRRGRSD